MLDAATLRQHCLNQTAAVEEFPFGPEAAVFKVMGKMFALMPVDAHPPRINLKVDPFIGQRKTLCKAVAGTGWPVLRHG